MPSIALYIIGRFYANIGVLYLTGKFYAVYIGVFSLVIDTVLLYTRGRFYAKLILQQITRVLLTTKCSPVDGSV